MAYSDLVVTATVVVTDEGAGKLKATVTYKDATGTTLTQDELVFQNSYTATGSWSPAARKALTGRPLAGDDFTFTLTGNGQTQEKKNDATGAISFDTINYTQNDIGKTYTYTIKETKGSEAGMSYSDLVITATVAITDKTNGELNVAVSYKDANDNPLDPDTALVFVNDYKASGFWQPAVQKSLMGRTLKAGEFTFTLAGPNQNQTNTNALLGSVLFEQVRYTHADIGKTYTYTIQETPGSETGMVYSGLVVTATVKVTDKGNGQLEAAATYEDGDGNPLTAAQLIFVNTYTAKGSWTPEVTKDLAGRPLKANDFLFQLKKDGNLVEEKANALDGKVTFTPIEYTQDDINKTYAFTINEVKGAEEGMTYDDMVMTVTVTIADAGGGVLTVTPTYPADKEFNNTYTAEGAWTPMVTKKLTGRALTADAFSFQLKMGDTVLDTKGNTAGDGVTGTVTFDTIEYTQDDIGKTYTYTITEVAGAEAGMTYDATVMTVTVTITDDKEGKLTATPTYPDDTEFNNVYVATGSWSPAARKALTGRPLAGDDFTFTLTGNGQAQEKTNDITGTVTFDTIEYTQDDIGKTYTYTITEVAGTEAGMTYDATVMTVTVTITDDKEGKLTATPTYPDDTEFNNVYVATGSWSPAARKALTGRPLAGDDFTFTLTGNGQAQEKTNDITGAVTFDTIEYTQDDIGKTYTYIIKEATGSEAGMSYSNLEFRAEVTITDGTGGQLNVDVAYFMDYERYTPDSLVFENTYAAQGDLTLTGTKAMEGRELAKEDLFTFTVKKGAETVATGANNGTGTITFTPISFTQEDVLASPITLTVTEDATTRPGVVIDPKSYAISVALTDEGEGKISAVATYPEGGLTLTNLYQPKLTDITARKIWVEGPEDDHTAVKLSLWRAVEGADASLVEGVTPTTTPPEGTADSFTYTWADQPVHDQDGKPYTYLVKEEGETEGEVTINGNRYAVTMADAVITNTFLPPGADELVVSIEKQLTGGAIKAGQFAFQMTGADVDETIRNDAAGKASFPAVALTEPGEYVYIITEIDEKQSQVTYDTASYEVKVTVTLDPDTNTLSHEVTLTKDGAAHTGAILFVNSLAPDPDPIRVPVQVKKVMEGMGLKAGEYSFTLYDRPGNAVETVKNNDKGEIIFDPVRVRRAGTYVFTIKEDAGSNPSLAYDPGVIQVRITAKDVGGSLVATVSYAKDGTPTANPAFVNRLKMPPTGDTRLWLPIILMTLSAALGVGYVVMKRKARKKP